MGYPSEMALLSRLHWWTVEYGLIGTLDHPKIYGAGLLSSIGESASCMQPNVPKLPYSLDAVNFAYDITKPQPQLFVTPTFEHLLSVLNSFADSMAFRKGGKESLEKAIECQNVCTAVYSSGLQVSGVFTGSGDEGLVYLKTVGPSALAYEGIQLEGHGKAGHSDGFGSPVGKLQQAGKSLENFKDADLAAFRLMPGEEVQLLFESRICVSGTVDKIIRRHDKIILIRFTDCTVTRADTGKIYFQPQWGAYDMAVGEQIVSVFCGAADKDAFEQVALISTEQTFKVQDNPEKKRLYDFYALVRKIRETTQDTEKLEEIWNGLRQAYPDDWLCALEILEILRPNENYSSLANTIESFLTNKQNTHPDSNKLIEDGLLLSKASDKSQLY
ncbi:phenylalanine-4-hydroxylase [bacterium A37T11]|nr:phenylalanine-4-hydroxylase [bacterium A37T11]